MKKFTLVMAVAVLASIALNAQDLTGLLGYYTFADADDVFANTAPGVADTVYCEGVFQYNPDAGPADRASVELTDWTLEDGGKDKYIALKAHNWFKLRHGIAANGGGDGTWVNDFSIIVDFRVPYDTAVYSLFEVNPRPTGSGYTSEMEIDSLKIGSVGAPASGEDPLGFSEELIVVDQWHRAVYVAKLSESVKVYLDGALAVETMGDFTDGRPAPYSADFYPDDAALRVGGNNETIDNNDPPRDAAKDIDLIAIVDRDLSAAEVAALGGPGSWTGVEERQLTQASFNFYPNPAKGMLYISGENLAQMEIVNLSGQVVKRVSLEGKNSVDISDMNSGMYLVRAIDTNNNSAIEKLIIE